MIAELSLYIAGVLLVTGALFTLLAAIGILRLPDLYTRMHAASKAGAVGSGLILVAVAVVSADASISVRALIGFAFILLTAPVAAHLLARAAYTSGYKPSEITEINDLEPKNKSARSDRQS